MQTFIKRSPKTWILVYAGFLLALTAANTGPNPDSDSALVSPGSLPAEVSIEKVFFHPTIKRPRRNDI
jgi:hypothetical protein